MNMKLNQKRDPWSAGPLEPMFHKVQSSVLRNTLKAVVFTVIGVLLAAAFAVAVGETPAFGQEQRTGPCATVRPATSKMACKFDHGHYGYNHGVHLTKAGKQKLVDKVRRKMNSSARTTAMPALYARMTALQVVNSTLRASTESCAPTGNYNPYAGGFNLCNDSGTTGDSKEGVQRAGSVLFCSAGAAITWWTAGIFMAAFVGSGCGFEAWKTFSPAN